MKNDEEVNYSLYDTNGDKYDLVIKKKDVAKYDLDHMATYRALQKLKRAGQKPINRAVEIVENPESADLRSPSNKKSKPESKKLERSPFAPEFESTTIEDDENDGGLPRTLSKAVRSLNVSFDHSLTLGFNEEDVSEVPHPTDEEEGHGKVVVLQEDVSEVVGDEEETIPKQSLWTEVNACHTFLNHLGDNVEELKKKRKKALYVKISLAMRKDGFRFSADELGEKKRGLDAQYCKYKKRSPEDRVKWEYWEAMDHLNKGSWPAGFTSCSQKPLETADSDEDEGAVGGIPSTSTHEDFLDTHHEEIVFPDVQDQAIEVGDIYMENTSVGEAALEWGTLAADKALLEEVSEVKDFFIDRPLLKNTDLFNAVASRLKRRRYAVSGSTAMTRYNALISKFRAENDKLKGTGGGQCKWELFDLVYDLEKDSVTTKPLVTVSAGSKANISRAYACVDELKKGRARAPNPTRVERKKKPTVSEERVKKLMGPEAPSGAMGFKNRVIELQEKRLELEMKFFNAFEGMREDAKERASNFKMGVDLLREIRGGKP